jgi:hypothetical protein
MYIFCKLKFTNLQYELWIYPGTFYGICAPHKLPSNHQEYNRTNKGVSIASNNYLIHWQLSYYTHNW